MQLTGALGKGHWSKVSNESKQAGLANAGDDPKRAALAPLLGEAVKSARTKWQADARLVEVKVIPNDDGTIDLTMAGGNGMLKLYSPSTDKGCIAMIGNFGEVNLYPEERPVSFSKLAIPTNVIELGKAISTARTQERQGMRLREASMYGVGDDLDLRQFCWVLTTDDTVIAIDALTVVECDYRKFMDGRERARKVPFAANETVINFMHTLPPDGLPLMMWQTLHAVHLEGYEEAILVRVPWRVIPEEEMDRHANREGSRIMYRGDTNLYPRGDHAPLTGETLERFMKDEDSIAIQCTPFGVQTVNPLASYPPGTKEKIVKQLEAHWRASGGR